MRVLHIIATGDRRGAELFASALSGGLAGDGIDQRVAILRCSGDPAVSFEIPTTVIGGRGRGLPIPGIRMDAMRINELRRVVRDFRPHVVQAHGGEPLKYALAVDRGNGSRIVYRRIGDSERFGSARLRQRAHMRLMRRAARVIAVAEILRLELVERFGLSPSRVVTIPNAVNPSTVESSRAPNAIRAQLGIPEGASVVLSLGALTWEKDPLSHMEIVAQAAETHPDLVHLMAGDGPLMAQVESEVRRRGAQARSRVLGARDDVADLLAASDLMLLASRTEGMPGCVIEAGVAGLPVVGYAVSGVAEVVVDGETGILAAPGDRAALVRGVVRVLDDNELRDRLGRAARQRCLSRFHIRSVAQRYAEVYREVAGIA